ncbi:MAG: leucine-rich repeat protein, partial [Paludibacteraceae bacterium]
MRKITFLLAALMCGAVAANAEDFTVNGIVYTINSDGETVSVGTNTGCTIENVVLPSSVNYNDKDYNVTAVSSSAFDNNQTIKTLNINVPIINQSAFRNTTLESVTFGENVSSLGIAAFEATKLTTVHIPAGINGMSTYNDQPFTNCQSITAFTVAEDNTNYCAIDGVLYNKYATRLIAFPLAKEFDGFRETVSEIGIGAFNYYKGFDTLVIPERMGKCSAAFHYSSVKTVIAENSELHNSFQNCTGIETIILGKGFTKVGELTFKGCTSLTKIICKSETMPTLGQTNTSSWPCFEGIDLSSVKLYVPCGQSGDYTADADKWADFTDITETLFYELQVSSANESQGTASVITDPDCDTNAQIEAVPASGYQFVQWSDGISENPRTLTVGQYAEIELTAEFKSSTPTALEAVTASFVYAESGRIYGAEGARIYDLLGRDVTRLNGSLSGVYVVK